MSQVVTDTPRPVAPLEYARPEGPSKAALWTGRVISVLPVLMLAMSAVMKFMPPSKEVTEGFEHLGWPMRLAFGLGILELSCALLYAIPQTAVLGAILLTGYLGGAVATHVHAGEPWGKWIFPVIFGVLVWLGLFLRDARVRALVPFRR